MAKNLKRVSRRSTYVIATMLLKSSLLIVGLQLVVGVSSLLTTELNKKDTNEAFVLFKALPDGDLQRIIRFNNTCAREIVLDWGQTYLTLRELWLGESGIKLSFFYQERSLTDCSEEPISELLDQEERDVCGTELSLAEQQRQALQGQQQAKLKLTRYPDPREAAIMAQEFPWLLTSELETRKRCELARASKIRKTDTSSLELIPSKSTTSAATATAAAAETTNNRKRSKRGIRELVIAPGTKWCGPHRLAYSYKDLGALDGLDRCCRRHDHCPQAITPFSERYGLFNYMPFTLSHCSCDERFRTCLKMTGTSSANLIGKIFFNMVQTKCFVLKPGKVCVKRSWWGKCEKHKYKKQGYLRDNTAY